MIKSSKSASEQYWVLNSRVEVASDDRIDNVKPLLGQAVGLSLYTESSKVQKELKLYEEIRAITAIG